MADAANFTTVPNLSGTSEETLLVGHLRRIQDHPVGQFSIHVHLSELRPDNSQQNFIRIAARAFEPLLANFDATLYVLSNHDLVLLCRDVPVDDVDQAVYKVRALFSEDPLTFGDEGSFEDRFTTWYDLTQKADFRAFMAEAIKLEEEANKRQKLDSEDSAPAASYSMAGKPLDPRNLAAINQRMMEVNISDLLRQQMAITIREDGKGSALFREHYVSMQDLQRRLAPNVNLFGNSWLFQYLTETIDRRMLTVVAHFDFESMPDSISLNLNISTVLSREFQTFHRSIGHNARKIVVELQLIDVFADLGMYAFARDQLRENGYRVLIDGLNPISFQFFNPGLLDADLIKLGWSKEFLGEVPKSRLDDMRVQVNLAGKNKMVLSRVDSEGAILWGLQLGIHRFQGHYADIIVEKMIAKGII
ncbi:MAG: hypothetical protein ACO3MW_13480 [Rhodospirillales bacterium]|jgi:EAL domain-containing protein (putative c-di-GMP-specific phosphodiesterase class I)